ncbi:MAG: ribosome maturation factor RimP [Gemmatimonadetes bacterium]|uniref:Ribosome maturation factor RimP n=1 Tax=Candidatus Kutchimonas denitrificans TaxID=3056748 RepID=A0AAE5CBR5_9BACT|nr:ribosome maturation factor RimP [Gemmatimonadota bacterium]NIR76217.1 ribosome maturation factor RimP [Candidatus Kutchimonas denitrificans]NIS00657.1 ribosome maturation factor RimP [Gemmatimonadota bacterium]NIT66802.1 ribosome maturation factor RimP [Gemmatimonadota bacterium]NIV23401.1 ribosome maturation factor RimP [Gemmatimonadota bacterium]
MIESNRSLDERVEQIAETVLGRLGYELVDLERAGARARPIVRLRIDHLDSEPGRGVTVEECARVSRELEEELEEQEDMPASYILEVSSPGIERPLRRPRDYQRALGRQIALHGYGPLARGSKRLQGVLRSVEGDPGEEELRLELDDGSEMTIPLSAVAKANLVFDWERFDFGRSSG